MTTSIRKAKGFCRAVVVAAVMPLLLAAWTPSLPLAYADPQLALPAVGTLMKSSPGFTPVVLKGIRVNQENPLLFDFFVDSGENVLADEAMREEAEKLIKYFMATLTLPEDDLWVNLSPYESGRIIPEALGMTDMGRDLLAQDYILKQVAASLTTPETELGARYWSEVESRTTNHELRTTNDERQRHRPDGLVTSSDISSSVATNDERSAFDVPRSSFSKVWIVPDKAVVTQYQNVAFVTECKLKVMMEQDYREDHGSRITDNEKTADPRNSQSEIRNPATEVFRTMILPRIEKEVNEGKNFAPLRQVFYSMILATWYKKNLKESVMGRVYMDQKKVAGIDLEDREVKQKIYDQYLASFTKGVYDFVREEYDDAADDYIPRKYFSGGVAAQKIKIDMETRTAASPAELIVSASVKGEVFEVDTGFDPAGMQGRAGSTALAKREYSDAVIDELAFVKKFNELWAKYKNRFSIPRWEPRAGFWGTREKPVKDHRFSNWLQILKSEQWLKNGHPIRTGYHNIIHTVRVAFQEWKFTNVREIDFDIRRRLVEIAFIHDWYRRGIRSVNGLDVDFRHNSEAFVPETIEQLTADFDRKISLGGEAGRSFLRDEFGWDRFDLALAKVFLYRSEYPLNGHKHPAYKDRQPVEFYKRSLVELRNILQERLGEDNSEDIDFLMRAYMKEAAYFAEYSDKMNGYVIRNFLKAIQLVTGLARELRKRAEGWWKPGAKTLVVGTWGFLKFVVGNDETFRMDETIATELGIGPLKILRRDQVFELLPAEGEGYAAQIAGFGRITSEFNALKDGRRGQIFSHTRAREFTPEDMTGEEFRKILELGQVDFDQALGQGSRASSVVTGSFEAQQISPALTQNNDSAVGGIDLDPAKLDLQTRGQNIKFDFKMSPSVIETLPIEGFTPVIFQITPVPNLQLLLSSPETRPFAAT